MNERRYQQLQAIIGQLLTYLVMLGEELPDGSDKNWIEDEVEGVRDLASDLRDMRREQRQKRKLRVVGK